MVAEGGEGEGEAAEGMDDCGEVGGGEVAEVEDVEDGEVVVAVPVLAHRPATSTMDEDVDDAGPNEKDLDTAHL
jgi:hypothetical protein